jgi:ABC-type amino acid transport system permease subunit
MPINALTAGVAALAINSTAFTIEIFRGGFAAVPVAQHDAARALGLRPALIMALVVVPQVFRIVLPPLGNQIVSVVLGSAQASIIGVAELTYQTQSIGSSTFRYFELFTIAALFYIACAQLISLVWRLLTGRAAHAPLGLLLLLKGLAITLELSLGSLVLGSLGGIVLGAMRSSEWRILKAVALVYIEAVRSIPFVILPVLRCTSGSLRPCASAWLPTARLHVPDSPCSPENRRNYGDRGKAPSDEANA